MSQDTCHCCEGLGPATPLTVDNRPGLSAIAFRAGTFSSFCQTMLGEIAGVPELAALTTRLSEDYSITVMELWAIVADVLTFYQERIANEGYLRTARLRDSMLRLVRLLDYQLAPGVAATSLLAFTVEPARVVEIPVGLRVQSVPEQDQKPQKYETVEKVRATPFWNKLRVQAAPSAVNPLSRGATGALLISGSDGLAIAGQLAPGQRLLLFRTSTLLPAVPVEKLTVKEIRYQEDRIRLAWKEPVELTHWDRLTDVSVYRREFRIFGHNAPSQWMKPSPPPPGKISIVWALVTLGAEVNVSGNTLPLDGRHDNLRPGSRLLLVGPGIHPRILSVTSVGQAQTVLGPMSDTVTTVTFGGPALPALNRRDLVLYELDGPAIRFWGLDYPDRLNAAVVHLPGRRTGAKRIEVGRAVDRKGFSKGVGISLDEIEKGRRVVLVDGRQPAISGSIAKASLFGADVHFRPGVFDPTTVAQLGFDAGSAVMVTGIASAADAATPVITNAAREAAVTLGAIGPRAVKLGPTGTTRDSVAAAFQAAIRAADGDVLFTRAVVLNVNDRFILMPGIGGADVSVRPTPDDPTTAIELGFDPEKTSAIAGVASAPLPPALSLSNPFRQLRVTIGPYGPRTLTLPASSLPSLSDAAQKLTAAIRAADPSPPFAGAVIAVAGDRLVALPGIVGEEIQEYLRLEIRLDSNASLDAAGAILYGNVALATHGETILLEVLGDGDAAEKFQKFALKKKPLTYVAAATESGSQTSLRVMVNRALWNEVPTLYNAGPADQAYVTRIADDGSVTVLFGDGRNGARLPAGRGNVTATYRQGSGLEGRVGAGKLTTPLDQPVGLKSVTNPVAAEGGGDPETLDKARENAPSGVRTFGRAVSLRDFADLAAQRPDIAKAYATWVWDHESRAIHLTVAGDRAGTFSRPQLQLIHASLDLQRDRNHKLLIDNFVRVPVVVRCTVDVMPDRIADDVGSAARSALLAALSFESLAFGASLHLSDIYAVLQGVDGVVALDIDLFHFKDRSLLNLLARGATLSPVQRRLVIFGARPNSSGFPPVRPAEQAWVENPDADIAIVTRGGLPS